jgi:hypothetical protein
MMRIYIKPITGDALIYTFVNNGVINYRFGKTMSDQQKHNANSAESDQDRVKNYGLKKTCEVLKTSQV